MKSNLKIRLLQACLFSLLIFMSSLCLYPQKIQAEEDLSGFHFSAGRAFTAFGGSLENLSETARLYQSAIWHHRPEIYEKALLILKKDHPHFGPALMYREQFILLENEEEKQNRESIGGFKTSPEDWFLHDNAGERVRVPDFHEELQGPVGERRWLMDPGAEGFQKRWIERTLADLKAGKWDGVFVDDVLLSLGAHQLKPEDWSQYPTDESLQKVVLDFLKNIQQAFQAEFGSERKKLVVANISESYKFDPKVLESFLNVIDGYFEEHFVTAWAWGETFALRQMQGLQSAAEKDKFVYLMTYADTDSKIPNLMETSLAAYLVSLGGYEKGFWSYRPYAYEAFNERPALEFWKNHDLGKSSSEIFYLDSHGNILEKSEVAVIWVRVFERGVAAVNLSEKFQSIHFQNVEISLDKWEGRLYPARKGGRKILPYEPLLSMIQAPGEKES